tara:strand:+ start:12495 stop:12878 length:384 start_codon:yes stop_codon:yes gene_type:complete
MKTKCKRERGFINGWVVNITDSWYTIKKPKMLHREDGPAVIEYNGDFVVLRKEWYKNGVLHRDGKPARILTYYYNKKEWYKNGLRHREDGPACISYDCFGNEHVKFYINGERVEGIDRPLTKSALKK